jgi:hypothetical protein
VFSLLHDWGCLLCCWVNMTLPCNIGIQFQSHNLLLRPAYLHHYSLPDVYLSSRRFLPDIIGKGGSSIRAIQAHTGEHLSPFQLCR